MDTSEVHLSFLSSWMLRSREHMDLLVVTLFLYRSECSGHFGDFTEDKWQILWNSFSRVVSSLGHSPAVIPDVLRPEVLADAFGMQQGCERGCVHCGTLKLGCMIIFPSETQAGQENCSPSEVWCVLSCRGITVLEGLSLLLTLWFVWRWYSEHQAGKWIGVVKLEKRGCEKKLSMVINLPHQSSYIWWGKCQLLWGL